jgi:stage III sporulation protein AA
MASVTFKPPVEIPKPIKRHMGAAIAAGPVADSVLKDPAISVPGLIIIPFLAPRLQRLLAQIPAESLREMEEIRLRQGQPLLLRLDAKELALTPAGQLTGQFTEGVVIEAEDLHRTLQLISQSSIYALEEELRSGFLTLPGGHRVGLVGQAVVDKKQIKLLKYISGLNFRISRQILGAADAVLPYLIDRRHARIYHTLLVSAPQAGKTTLLRDIIRQVSNGIKALDFPGVNVGLVDERSEIAGCFAGVPQKEVGLRTDVLDRCPKAEGMLMLLRSMSPRVVATDEIGRPEDAEAIEDLLNAGVSVITTVHGSSLADLKRRPVLRKLMDAQVFERIILLGRSRGPGTIEAIVNGQDKQTLWGKMPSA